MQTNNNRTYAAFNQLTITGRISHTEVVDGQYGEFVAVTLLTELQNDAQAIAVQFNTKDLIALQKGGYLNNGRQVTIVGHLKSFTELYFDKKAGKTKRLQRPRLELDNVVLMPGAMGPGPKKDAVDFDDELDIDAPEVDEAPKYQPLTDPSAL
jgi:hypothetical protein